MSAWVSLTLVVGLLLGAGEPGGGTGREEVNRLAGTWILVAHEEGGKVDRPPAEHVHKVIVAGDKWIEQEGKPEDLHSRVATYRLDPAKTPRTIDITPMDGRERGKVLLGIYKLEGDTLTVCLRPRGGRPSELSSKSSRGGIVLTFKRLKR